MSPPNILFLECVTGLVAFLKCIYCVINHKYSLIFSVGNFEIFEKISVQKFRNLDKNISQIHCFITRNYILENFNSRNLYK
jgi:hypothetical protein